MDGTENPFWTTDQLLEWLAAHGPKYANDSAALEAVANLAALDKLAISGRRVDTERRETIPAIEWADLRIVWSGFQKGEWVTSPLEGLHLFDLFMDLSMSGPDGIDRHAASLVWRDLRFEGAGILAAWPKVRPALKVDVEKQFAEHCEKIISVHGREPTKHEDEAWGKSSSISRDKARDLRKEWRSGRKTASA